VPVLVASMFYIQATLMARNAISKYLGRRILFRARRYCHVDRRKTNRIVDPHLDSHVVRALSSKQCVRLCAEESPMWSFYGLVERKADGAILAYEKYWELQGRVQHVLVHGTLALWAP
jgi:hypothetical protein